MSLSLEAATPPSRRRFPHQLRQQGHLVHRRDGFRAEKIMQERLHKNPKIEVVWNTVLDEVIGTDDPKRSPASDSRT